MKFSDVFDRIDKAVDFATDTIPDVFDQIALGADEVAKASRNVSAYLRGGVGVKSVEDTERAVALKARIEAAIAGPDIQAIGDGQLRKTLLALALALLERFLKS